VYLLEGTYHKRLFRGPVSINNKGLAIGSNPAICPLYVSVLLGDLSTTGTKRHIPTLSNGIFERVGIFRK
jgi:hypothetical protein